MIGLTAAMRVLFVAGLACPNVSVASGELAAPWIILIEEEGTRHRTALTDWHENLQLMLSIKTLVTKRPEQLSAGAGLRVALFSGPEWKNWREAGIDPRALSFEQTNSQASLYRATRDDPAYWKYDGPFTLRPQLRIVDSMGVDILESHGIALRSPGPR